MDHSIDPLTGLSTTPVSYPHTQIGSASAEGLGAMFWNQKIDEEGKKTGGWVRGNYGLL